MSTPSSLSSASSESHQPLITFETQLREVRAEAALRYQQHQQARLGTEPVNFNFASSESKETTSQENGLVQEQIRQEVLTPAFVPFSSRRAHDVNNTRSDAFAEAKLSFSDSKKIDDVKTASINSQFQELQSHLNDIIRNAEMLDHQIERGDFPFSEEVINLSNIVRSINREAISLLENTDAPSFEIAEQLEQHSNTLETYNRTIPAAMNSLPGSDNMPARESFQGPLETIRSAAIQISGVISFLNDLATSELSANQFENLDIKGSSDISRSSISSLTENKSDEGTSGHSSVASNENLSVNSLGGILDLREHYVPNIASENLQDGRRNPQIPDGAQSVSTIAQSDGASTIVDNIANIRSLDVTDAKSVHSSNSQQTHVPPFSRDSSKSLNS